MKYLLAVFLVLFSFSLQANTLAKISKTLMFEDGNIVYIYPVGGVQNPPDCHGSNGDYLSFKISRPMAKEYLSVLMMALLRIK